MSELLASFISVGYLVSLIIGSLCCSTLPFDIFFSSRILPPNLDFTCVYPLPTFFSVWFPMHHCLPIHLHGHRSSVITRYRSYVHQGSRAPVSFVCLDNA